MSRRAGLVAAVAVVAVTGCGGGGPTAGPVTTAASTTTTVGEPVAVGSAVALELDEEQCYAAAAAGDPATTTTTTSAATTATGGAGAVDLDVVLLVDCAGPHEGRVYAAFCLVPAPDGELVDGNCPGSTDTAWPGGRELRRAAVRLCLARFEDEFGEPYATSTRTTAELIPSETAWRAGHRRVVCAVEP